MAVLFPNGMYLRDAVAAFAATHSLVFYDVRNRGRSDAVTDPAQRKSAILKDVADLEAVRRHFDFSEVALVGHSYVGLAVALYAMTYPQQVSRLLQLSPIEPFPGKAYGAHFRWSDDVMAEVFARIAKLREEQSSLAPEVLCEKFWAVLRAIYVFNPADAEKGELGPLRPSK